MKYEHPTHAHRAHHALEGHRDKPPSASAPHDADGDARPSLVRVLLLSVGVTLLAELVWSAVLAGLLLRTPDPLSLAAPMGWLSLGLASGLGGWLAGRKYPDAPLLAGLVSGGVVALLLTVVGLCLDTHTASDWILRGVSLLLHLIGAVLSRRRPRPASHTAGHHHS